MPLIALYDLTLSLLSSTFSSPSQLLRPLNTLDDLCRLMQTYVNVRSSAQSHPSGVSVLCVSSELCNRLGACHITMCGTGMQRSAWLVIVCAVSLACQLE